MDSIPTHMTQLSFHQIQLFLLISIKLNIISFVRHLCLKCISFIYLKEIKYVKNHLHSKMVLAILFTTAKKKKKPKHPTIDE